MLTELANCTLNSWATLKENKYMIIFWNSKTLLIPRTIFSGELFLRLPILFIVDLNIVLKFGKYGLLLLQF